MGVEGVQGAVGTGVLEHDVVPVAIAGWPGAFADLSEVNRTYMGGIEPDERNLTLRTVERLAERIGIEHLNSPAGGPVVNDGQRSRTWRRV